LRITIGTSGRPNTMGEVISLSGLKKLASMNKKDRPENYKSLVMNYLQYKQDWINSHDKCRKHNIDVFIEAVNLARKVDVVWKMTKLNY
jgi:hypothetical protein